MPTQVHANADIHTSAQLGDNICVESGAVIEQDCVIGSGCTIGRHSIIWRGSIVGENNRIFPFCSLGGEPQDKKYKGEQAPLIIGNNNTIREYCFINKGTDANDETRIGNDNWIMAYVHVAHDCIIGDNTTIANTVQLAGHVEVGARAIIGGGALVHQFRRIGIGAIIGGGEVILHDVPPYALVGKGVVSVNREGMHRYGFSNDIIDAMRHAYKILYRQGLPLTEAIDHIEALTQAQEPPLQELLAFLRFPNIQLIRPRKSA